MARVLVVDDDPSIRDLITDTCKLDHHDVRVEDDAVGALAAYDEFQPDVMILDMVMPGGGAPYLIDQLRQRRAEEPCPWIVVTGLASAMDTSERTELEAVAVLSKPFSIDSLRMAVKTALG